MEIGIAAELSTCKLAERLVPLLYGHSTLPLWLDEKSSGTGTVRWVLFYHGTLAGETRADLPPQLPSPESNVSV